MILCLLSLISGMTPSAAAATADPVVVPTVDFVRYAGLWHEVARSPNFFQRNCVRSTAQYKLLGPGEVSVHNICYKEGGKISDIKGTAKVVDPAVPAKLRVDFGYFRRGDYWITHLHPDYEWAIVSGPKKKSIFILARKFPMDEKQRSELVQMLKSEGYMTDNLVYDRMLDPDNQ